MNVCKCSLFPGCCSHNDVSDLNPLCSCVTHNKGSVVKIDLLESRSRMALGTALYWSFQVWVAIRCIVEGIAPQAPQAGICGTGGVAALSKRCEFLICTPPCVTACEEGDCSVCCN